MHTHTDTHPLSRSLFISRAHAFSLSLSLSLPISAGLVDILAVKKEGNHLQLIKASYKHFLSPGNSDAVHTHGK